jgi:hypothetical protein
LLETTWAHLATLARGRNHPAAQIVAEYLEWLDDTGMLGLAMAEAIEWGKNNLRL